MIILYCIYKLDTIPNPLDADVAILKFQAQLSTKEDALEEMQEIVARNPGPHYTILEVYCE